MDFTICYSMLYYPDIKLRN